MIITISGKPGSGKNSVAKELAKRLHLKHYSLGDFMSEMALNKNMTLLELSKRAETNSNIDKELDQRQINLGKKEDNFVIDSRLGFHFIPHSIKIFLDVNLESGAQRIFNDKREDEKENKTLQATLKNIKRRIRSERERYKKYYNIDHYDKKQYDIIIDTTNLTVEQVTDIILEKIRKL